MWLIEKSLRTGSRYDLIALGLRSQHGLHEQNPEEPSSTQTSMHQEEPPKSFRAAQYVRMSTEHQQYSTHNQADTIREYAERRGIEIVRT